MFLYAFSLNADFLGNKRTMSELVEVVDSKRITTYSSSRARSIDREIGVVRVRLNNGKFARIDIGNADLPAIGSFM